MRGKKNRYVRRKKKYRQFGHKTKYGHKLVWISFRAFFSVDNGRFLTRFFSFFVLFIYLFLQTISYSLSQTKFLHLNTIMYTRSLCRMTFVYLNLLQTSSNLHVFFFLFFFSLFFSLHFFRTSSHFFLRFLYYLFLCNINFAKWCIMHVIKIFGQFTSVNLRTN